MPEKEQPIPNNLRKDANAIAKIIDEALNSNSIRGEKYGFALLIFPFGDPDENKEISIMSYISNADREDMIAAMKEFIANAEGRLHTFNPTRKTN